MAYTFKVVKRDGEHFLNVMEVGNVVFGGYLGFMNDLKQYSYRHKLNCIDIDGDIWLDGDTMIKVYKWLKCEDKSFLSSLRKLGVYSTKRRLNQTHRIHVMYTQKYRCAICKELLKPTCELDHIVSLEEGGKDVLINIQALCVPCHKDKTYDTRLQKHPMFEKASINDVVPSTTSKYFDAYIYNKGNKRQKIN